MNRLKFIESRHNPVIREALKVKDRRYEDRILIEGENTIEMARASRCRIIRVLFSKRYKNQSFLREIAMESELIETTDRIISLLSDTETPQGIIAIATYRTLKLDEIPERADHLLIVCDGIQEPGNLGTVTRTADASGADAVVILPGTCDPLMQKVIRASVGSIFNIPLVFSERDRLKEWLRMRKVRLIATAVTTNRTLYDLDLTVAVAFVFGNEARGVSKESLAMADEVIRIPILGKAESLNVSVAASICLYETVRQRLALRS